MAEQHRERPPVTERASEQSVLGEFGVNAEYLTDEQITNLIERRLGEISRLEAAHRLSRGEAEHAMADTRRWRDSFENDNYAEASQFLAQHGLEKVREAISNYSDFQTNQLNDGEDLSPEERDDIRATGARLARAAAISYANGFMYLQGAITLHQRGIHTGELDSHDRRLVDLIETKLDDERVRALLHHGYVARAIPEVSGLRIPARQSQRVTDRNRHQRAEAAARQVEISAVPRERIARPEIVEKPRLRTRLGKYLEAIALNPILPTGKSKAGYLAGLGVGIVMEGFGAANASIPVRGLVTMGLMSLNALRDSYMWRKFFKSTTAEERLRIETQMQKGASLRRGFVAGLAASSLLDMVAPDAAETIFHSDLAREYGEFGVTVLKETAEAGIAATEDLGITDFIADEEFGTGSAFGGSSPEQPTFQGFGDTDFFEHSPGELDNLTDNHIGPSELVNTKGELFDTTLEGSIREIREAADELGQAHVDAFESAGDALDNWYNEVFGEGRVVEGHRRRPGSERERPDLEEGTHVYQEVTVEAGDTLDKILEEEGVHPSLLYGSVDSMHDFVAQNEQVLMIGNEEGIQDFYQFLYDNPDATSDEVRKYFYDAVRVIGPGQELNLPTGVITDAPELPDLSNSGSLSAANPISDAFDEWGIEPKPLSIYSDLGERITGSPSSMIAAGGIVLGGKLYLNKKRHKSKI